MTKIRIALSFLMIMALVLPKVAAQEKPKSESKVPSTTLKVDVVFTEYEGEKKVKNLPYNFLSLGNSEWGEWTSIRTGSRLPVVAGKNGELTYIDVGTNIDSRARRTEDGKFEVMLRLERSWAEGEVTVPLQPPGTEGHPAQFGEPIIRQFKTELMLAMRDGQTIQSTFATDPLSGKVLTITVTLTVVK